MKSKRQHITNQTYNDSAKKYQDSFMDLTLYNNSFNQFCKFLEKKHSKILEIACGPGNITKYIVSKRPDFDVLGIDIAPKMVELARINNPSARFETMDVMNISSLNEKFDAVINSFCLPYLSKTECAAIIRDSYNLMNPGGYMYLSTMEGNDSESGYEIASFDRSKKVYINYHQKKYLVTCFTKSNFDIVDFQTVKSPKPNGTSFTDMIFILQKKLQPSSI